MVSFWFVYPQEVECDEADAYNNSQAAKALSNTGCTVSTCIIVRGSLGLNEVQRGGPLLLLLSSFVTALVADARSLEFACKI
jgi:hypothetical protein